MVLLKMVKNVIVAGRKTVLKTVVGPKGPNTPATSCHVPSGQLNSAVHHRVLAVTGTAASILGTSVEMITGVEIRAIAMDKAHIVRLHN